MTDNKGPPKFGKATQINMVAHLQPEKAHSPRLNSITPEPDSNKNKSKEIQRRSTIFKHSKTQNMKNYMNLPGITPENIKKV